MKIFFLLAALVTTGLFAEGFDTRRPQAREMTRQDIVTATIAATREYINDYGLPAFRAAAVTSTPQTYAVEITFTSNGVRTVRYSCHWHDQEIDCHATVVAGP